MSTTKKQRRQKSTKRSTVRAKPAVSSKKSSLQDLCAHPEKWKVEFLTDPRSSKGTLNVYACVSPSRGVRRIGYEFVYPGEAANLKRMAAAMQARGESAHTFISWMHAINEDSWRPGQRKTAERRRTGLLGKSRECSAKA